MPDWIAKSARMGVRLVLLALGAVFMVSLLAAGLVLAVAAAVRVGWGRLTGRPVSPWTFRVHPRNPWGRSRAAPDSGAAETRTEPRASRYLGDHEVVDVEVKPPLPETRP
ncbi:MAG TPA: hypothetical protein VGE70_07255 [Burkholderiaceae bacterium]